MKKLSGKLKIFLLLGMAWFLFGGCGAEHVISLMIGIGDITHAVKNPSPYEKKYYKWNDYSIANVRTYHLVVDCDRTEFKHVNPELKEPYCRDLGPKVKERLHEAFPGWQEEEDPENQPDLTITAELEGVWGGANQNYKITQETVVLITVERSGVVMAEYRLKWKWNSEKIWRNARLIYPEITNDKAFLEALPKVAENIVDFVAHPENFDPEKTTQKEFEGHF